MSSAKEAKKGPPRPQGQSEAPRKPKSSSLALVVVLGVALVAVLAVLVGPRVLGSRRASAPPAPVDVRLTPQPRNVAPGEVVRGNSLPNGAYPNVTDRIQILDYGIKQPRPIDGRIPFEILARVPVEEWGPQRSVAQPNIERGTPLIMRNSVASKWPAQGKWTPEYFKTSVAAWKKLTRAKRLRRAFINFEYGQAYDEVTPWDFWENDDSRQEHPMSIDEWFDKATNHTDNDLWFLAEEVPKELLPDVSPRHTLKLKDQTWVYFSVWMGEGGATTAAHWDMDSNLYVQFYGRKRFLLFHPDTYKSWKSYPRVSPNHKQVVMEHGDPSRYSYRLVEGAPLPVAYEAILYPGDMLYLPAYWYHHVEAMLSPPGTTLVGGKPTSEPEHLSISANFWSTNDMDLLIGMSEPLPFDGGFHVESEGRFTGDKAAIINAFPAGYPRAKVPLATRLVLASMVSDGVFRTRGAAAAQARYCTFLRFVHVFGPSDPKSAARVCPPVLTAADQARIAATIKSSAQPMILGLVSMRLHATRELEFLNYLETVLVGALPTRDHYDALSNCFSFTLGQDPSVSTGFASRYEYDDAQKQATRK